MQEMDLLFLANRAKEIFTLYFRRFLVFFSNKVVPLALSDALARLVGFLVLALIARRFGTEEIGLYNLGIVIAAYAISFSDLGTRQIGVRLVAGGHADSEVVYILSCRRLVLLFFALLFTVAYAFIQGSIGRVGLLFLAFPLSAIFVAFSHDWLFWGWEQYWEMTFFGGIRALTFLIGALLAFLLQGGIGAFALAYIISYGTSMFWSWRRSRIPPFGISTTKVSAIKEFAWFNMLPLSLAVIVNQLFQTGDILLLGVLSNERQLGIYSMASRFLFFLFSIYYIVTNSIYTWLSRKSREGGLDTKELFVLIGGSGLLGLMVSILLYPASDLLLMTMFGMSNALPDVIKVFHILLLVLPLEFMMATFGTLFVGMGRNVDVLICIAIGTFINLAGNVYIIPSYGAKGAAIISIISYLASIIAFFVIIKYKSKGLLLRTEQKDEDTKTIGM